jgi:glycogen synthase
MKILVISNFYPPHFIGGYELGCKDVVEGLRSRGHEVRVLTSTHGVGRRTDDGHVHRWLVARLHPPAGRASRWTAVIGAEVQNQAGVRQAIRLFCPDVIYVWNVWYASLSLALEAERAGVPINYYVSDLWPTRWKEDSGVFMLNAPHRSAGRVVQWMARLVIRAAGARIPAYRPALRFLQSTSDFIRRSVLAAGYGPDRTWVIPWAVDLDRFRPGPVRWPVKRVLYAGQLIQHKGVHTALEAFARVAKTDAGADLRFTLAGGAAFTPEYEHRLRRIAADAGVADRVVFLGQVPRGELADLYADHDVLIFPSEWDEPFSISLVEAMAAGLAIVATATGGTPEIAWPEDNALVFPAGSSEGCAAQLARLLADRPLYEAIRRRARETAAAGFSFPRMLDQVEKSLRETLAVGGAKQP